jgi:hypothetical protein
MSFLRRKTIKGRQYLYEVENTWEDGHVRQKVLRYVGPVTPIRKRKAEPAAPAEEKKPE